MRRLRAAGAAVAALAGLALACAAPAAAVPGGTAAPQTWFDTWHVHQLWASGADGRGVTIAEIDTGVDASLPVLAGRVERGIDLGSQGGDGRIDRDTSAFGHGTAMATIMVGRPGALGIEGLAPGATILPVAVPLTGTTDASSDDHVPTAIRWAVDHGAKIISMSLGGVRRESRFRVPCPSDTQAAIFYALRKGAVVFAASGNRGVTDSAVEEPGVCLGVVAVGAVDAAGTVAPFSSRHPYLGLTAPGVGVASIGPGGTPYAGEGTSQATAVTAAVAALVWSRHPRLTGSQLVARLLATLDGHRSRPDPAYGYGTLNAYRAVTADVPRAAPNPIYALARPFYLRALAPAPSAPPAPRPIVRAASPPGSYAVDAAPPGARRQVVAGLSVAAAGLALLLALATARILARRRPRAAPAAPSTLAAGG